MVNTSINTDEDHIVITPDYAMDDKSISQQRLAAAMNRRGSPYDSTTGYGKDMIKAIREERVAHLMHFVRNDEQFATDHRNNQDILCMAQLSSQWLSIKDCFGPIATFDIPNKDLCKSLRQHLGLHWWMFGAVCFTKSSFDEAHRVSQHNMPRRSLRYELGLNFVELSDESSFFIRECEKLDTLSEKELDALKVALQSRDDECTKQNDEEEDQW